VSRVRIFLDSCMLVEGVCAPWSDSRGVLILGRSSLFTFVLADIVLEESERALARKLHEAFGAPQRLREEFRFLIQRLNVERIPHVSDQEFLKSRSLIRHVNDVPVLAAAINARPDWLVTDNTAHFDEKVSRKTGLRIATPKEFLSSCGKLF
jgi:predicted nucleic acid-binding protein